MRVSLYAAALAALALGVPFAGGGTTVQPPPPTIDSMPPNPSGSGDASFTFSDTDLTVTFQCRLDNGGFAPCVSPTNYPGLSDGSHTFDVKAVDSLLNESGVTSYTWTIVTTPPPLPSIDSGPQNPTNQTTASFTFSDSEPGVTFKCRLDKGAFPPCTSPASYSGLAPGLHTFFVRAGDALGNETDSVSYAWMIDLTPPPTPTVDSRPPNPSGSESAEFTFSDAESGVSFDCSLDAGSFSNCSSPRDYASLLDGNHTFAVRAVDAAGNASDPTAPYTWTIDTVNPVVTLTDKPSLLTNQTSVSFTFSSNKPRSTYECKLDGGAFLPNCSSPQLYTGLADGSHTFAVRATAVTIGPSTTYTWTIDTIPPETAIASGPPADSSSASATFTFTSSEPGSTFVCTLDAGGISPCALPQTYSGLGDGAHTFGVQAVDAAGNADATAASYSWQIRGVGPGSADHTPPGNVKRLKREVGYGVLKLAWTRPPDPDFDHVNVFVSTNSKSLARSLVYKGAGTNYTAKRFKNGLYYRYAVISYDHAGNASRGVGAVVPASILLRSPRDGAVVRTPPRLVWDEIVKSTFYNVQLYYGAQKVLSAWPNHAKLRLTRRWSYLGRRFQLRKGTYHWYVWPGFGPRSRGRYGQLLGQGSFGVA